MSSITNSLLSIRLLDDLSEKDTLIHRLHPLVKLLTTVAFLTVVISFNRYEISGLMIFIFYPVIIFSLAEIPIIPILKRVLLMEPIIIGIGILNPIFDQQLFNFCGIEMSRGWITLLSIMIKSGLTETSALLLVATTGMNKLAEAMRMIKIPRIFVMQLLLTYRYIIVMMEEVGRILRAYSLRSPNQKGLHISVWGSLTGQLILRTFDRGERIYQSMRLRGYTGEYNSGSQSKLNTNDFLYLVGCCLFFIIARIYNLPLIIGSLLTGVI